MTLPRLAAMNAHWDVFPPVHKSVARLNSAFLKDGGKVETEKKDKKKGTLQDLLAAFGHNGGIIKQ